MTESTTEAREARCPVCNGPLRSMRVPGQPGETTMACPKHTAPVTTVFQPAVKE